MPGDDRGHAQVLDRGDLGGEDPRVHQLQPRAERVDGVHGHAVAPELLVEVGQAARLRAEPVSPRTGSRASATNSR
ncbi:MAG: hypothetical protein ACRDSP_18500 [Pseudonocardiaceae bacterium]